MIFISQTLSTTIALVTTVGICFAVSTLQDKFREWKRNKEIKDEIKKLPYDPESPMVKHFQKVAGIKPVSPLQRRYNNIRFS